MGRPAVFRFTRTPCGEEEEEVPKVREKEKPKACSIILILGCVWVTFGGMIVSHLGVWGVIFPPVWSHSPDLCKLAVKHITTRPSCLTRGLLIHTSGAAAASQVFRHFLGLTLIQEVFLGAPIDASFICGLGSFCHKKNRTSNKIFLLLFNLILSKWLQNLNACKWS